MGITVVDEDKLEESDSTLLFRSINQAETALSSGIIKPSIFIEHDDTIHTLIAFDPRPVGYSGFMDCVTHALALTDEGLFEVGRCPAMDLASSNRYWGWFLHRRLATSNEVTEWMDNNKLTEQELMNRVYNCNQPVFTFVYATFKRTTQNNFRFLFVRL